MKDSCGDKTHGLFDSVAKVVISAAILLSRLKRCSLADRQTMMSYYCNTRSLHCDELSPKVLYQKRCHLNVKGLYAVHNQRTAG